MNIYRAISFKSVVDKGGSTYPWLVEALNGQGKLVLCVVKMFTPNQLRQQHAVAKELYGNVLAHALQLPAPEAGLMRFDPDFIATLSPEHRTRHEACHKGLRFCTLHQEGYSTFDDHLIHSKVQDYDMAAVYAFDNLVWNTDRGGEHKKPNLLIRDEDYLLIDHEMIFPFANDPDQPNETYLRAFKQKKSFYPAQKHLFYPYLKKKQVQKKISLFDPFLTVLTKLNISVVERAADFLDENGHSKADLETILAYLCTVQADPDSFRHILLSQLQ